MNVFNNEIEIFKTEIHNIYKAYRFSHFGLYNLRSVFNDYKKKNKIENFKIVDQECNIEIKFSELDMEEAKEHGFYQMIMAGNTIVMIYNLWEDNYRTIFAKCLGYTNKTDLKNNLFGDLGKIRNAIVHNHYKRTSDIDKLEILGFLFPNDRFILDSFAVHDIYVNALKALELMKQPSAN
ncbi:hypothetical protein OMO38_19215 [Chryseobacterium sp. 09-1422]|uniref:RiboL-PSP-HEPN domain-containing protein n=1 Tax=Chryseobacterium kimseyorum TaxID=2984028 RepID=A0ABT3I3M0_9FLAO|nr:hypothetical protein [Chryseobacterium kimseyorum]MCW3170665.1 hypothetical protein [Chryseobacterium kimseyorum]